MTEIYIVTGVCSPYRIGVIIRYDVYTREIRLKEFKIQVTLRHILEKDVDEKYYKTL